MGIPQFDGKNFSHWKFRIETYLDKENVKECIETESAAQEFVKKDKKCKALIIACLSDSYLELIKDQTTSRQIWLVLQKHFERKSIANQLYLRRKLLSLKLQPEETLESHLLKFDATIRELKDSGATLENSDIVCHLLLTLPKSYDSIATAFELVDEEKLTMEFVKRKLMDQEMKRKMNNECIEENKAAFSNSSNRKFQNKKWSDYSKRSGNSSNDQQSRSPFRYNCYNCGKVGHKKSECRFRRREAHVTNKEEEEEEKDKIAFITYEKPLRYDNNNKLEFYLDSGATDHLINSRIHLKKEEMLSSPIRINVAKTGQACHAESKGNIEVVLGIINIIAEIKDVLYIKDLRCNLLSVQKLANAGIKTIFDEDRAILKKNGKIIAVANRENNLYKIEFKVNEKCVNLMTNEMQAEIWHRRLGHISVSGLQTLAKENYIKLKQNEMDDLKKKIYEECVKGKLTRSPHTQKLSQRSTRPLQLVHTDICGPIQPTTHDGKKYFLTFIDDFTHFTVTYLLKQKSETLEKFKEYEAWITNHFERNISIIRCDNGTEYTSNDFKNLCKEKGIRIQNTIRYTPEQNGVAERANRTLIEKAKSMLMDSKLNSEMWGEAILCGTYLVNRIPTVALNNKLPAENFYKKPVNFKKLKVFGCVAYSLKPKCLRKKFEENTDTCIMIGYSENGYRLWDPINKKVQYGDSVAFDESKTINHITAEVTKISTELSVEVEENSKTIEETENDVIESDEEEEEVQTRRSQRPRKPPNYLEDYDLSESHLALHIETLEDLPKDYNDIFNKPDSKEWIKAVNEELDSLTRNNTWKLVPKPDKAKVIDSKWVFRIKRNNDGEPETYKARLVAKGFMQQKNFTPSEIYAPVAKMNTLRVLLKLINDDELYAEQLDVKSAFLHGDLEDEIYMNLPEGHKENKNKVCKLIKSLYGLKEAPKCWNKKFNEFMRQQNFKTSAYDSCLYYEIKENIKIYILLYVDDLIIATNSKVKMKEIKEKLNKNFDMKNLGQLHQFVGINIVITENGMFLNQKHYLERVLHKFNMENCKETKSPCELNLDIDLEQNTEIVTVPYRELIGCLIYAALGIRPDLCAAVNYFSRFQDKPINKTLWTSLKRVLRYVKGTLNYGLFYEKPSVKGDIALQCYVDASWAASKIDRKSTTGYIYLLNKSTISWATRKQRTVALSSTEAEYIALAEAASEGLWTVGLLEELSAVKVKIKCYEDNQSCIKLCSKPDHKRLKHIDVKYNFLKQLVDEEKLLLYYVSSNDQVADALTKPVTSQKIQMFCKCINLISFEMSSNRVTIERGC